MAKVLAPHRVIGVVGDGATPFALQSLGGEPFITVSVGYAFQVFSVEHLRVAAVSQQSASAYLHLILSVTSASSPATRCATGIVLRISDLASSKRSRLIKDDA